MQLVGEVMGQVSDALNDNGVPGFDETNVTNDWGRIILEAAGSAAVAGVTGGNVGAATGSSIAGNIVTAGSFNTVKDWAIANSNGDPKVALLLTNIIENTLASMGGAAAGGAIAGGSGALNGSDISSALQQYNQTKYSPQLMRAIAGGLVVSGGVATQQGNQPVDLDKALDNFINDITNAFSNAYNYIFGSNQNDVNNANQGNQGGSQVNNSANSSAQSTPADPNQQPDPDNDDKDDKTPTKYETNDAHDPKSGKYIQGKDVEPADAKITFERLLKEGNLIKGKYGNWYGVGENGVYRYSAKNTNTAHFSGYMTREAIKAPNKREVINALEKQMGEAAARKWK